MPDTGFVIIFSHSPQIKWFSFIARVLRAHFGIPSILWVIGEKDRLEGEKLGEFSEVVNLIGDDSVFSQFEDVTNAVAYLKLFEDELGEICISRDIAMDRYISQAKWPLDKALIFAAGILLRIRREITKSGQPIFCIGEDNCLHYRIAKRAVASPYICAYMMGYWEARFYIEYTMYYQWESCQEQYHKFIRDGIPEKLRGVIEKRHDELVSQHHRPAYTVRYHKSGGNSIYHRLSVARFIGALKRTWVNLISDREVWNPKSQSVLHNNLVFSMMGLLREYYRKKMFKCISLKQVPKDKEIAGFFLHMQPEHTVDGVAFEYRDQVATALTIAAALPAGMILLVKEHYTMVGKRPVSFYEKLCKCPNIRLLDDTVTSHVVVNRSKLMFTLSGSVALESMYVGKPAIVLGKIYHTAFRGIYPAGDIRDLAALVTKVLNSAQPGATHDEAVTALAAMYSSSYSGRISSHFTLEEMGAEENLDAIASAFAKEFDLLGA